MKKIATKFSKIAFALYLFLVSFAIAIYVLLILGEILGIIIAGVIAILLIIIIILVWYFTPKIRKKREDKRWENTVNFLRSENQTQEEYLERLEDTLRSKKSDEIIAETINIPKEFFSKNLKKKICGICKLELREGQDVYRCESCLNLFHFDHMILWLQGSEKCPICGDEFYLNTYY